jgi:hypothetical protein
LESKLVSFLYELMRDYITPGKVSEILKNCQDPNVVYSNGFLAKYAAFVAKNLEETK